jgi:ribosome biogenesis protein Nip4
MVNNSATIMITYHVVIYIATCISWHNFDKSLRFISTHSIPAISQTCIMSIRAHSSHKLNYLYRNQPNAALTGGGGGGGVLK